MMLVLTMMVAAGIVGAGGARTGDSQVVLSAPVAKQL